MDEERNICSTCLKRNNSKLTSITDLDYDGISFLDKLRACVSSDLEIKINNMPQMCKSCMATLNISYKFRETVLESLQRINCIKEKTHIGEDIISIVEDTSFGEDTCLENNPASPSEHNSSMHLSHETFLLSIKEEIPSDKEDKDSIHAIIEQMKRESLERKKGKRKECVQLSCDQCSLSFKTENKFQQHIRNVHNVNSLICMYCGNVFKTSFHLKEHITCHTGEKNYNCSQCDKAFPRLSSLKRHMKSHYAPPGQKTKKTPFLCTICGKNFPFSNGASRHMRIHFGVKSYECQICQRKFNQSTHLQVHMRTHSGEKPYICEHCGESFTLKAGLQKHFKTRHKGEEENGQKLSFKEECTMKNEADVYFN